MSLSTLSAVHRAIRSYGKCSTCPRVDDLVDSRCVYCRIYEDSGIDKSKSTVGRKGRKKKGGKK